MICPFGCIIIDCADWFVVVDSTGRVTCHNPWKINKIVENDVMMQYGSLVQLGAPAWVSSEPVIWVGTGRHPDATNCLR